MQEYTAGFKGSYVARNENGPLTSFAIVVYRIFSSSVKSFECRIAALLTPDTFQLTFGFPSKFLINFAYHWSTNDFLPCNPLITKGEKSSFPVTALILTFSQRRIEFSNGRLIFIFKIQIAISLAQSDLMVCKIDRCFSWFASPLSELLSEPLSGGIFIARRQAFFHRKAYLACTWIRCKCSKLREWLSPKVPISRGEKECD